MQTTNLEYIMVSLAVVIGLGIIYALNRQQGVTDAMDLRTINGRVDEQDKQIKFLLREIAELQTWTTTLRMERDVARQEARELRNDLDRLKTQMGLLS